MGHPMRLIFVSASHQIGLDTRSMTRKSIIVGIRGGEGRARAAARALLDYVNEGLMSLAGHGLKFGSRHGCLIIAKTGQQGSVLYKGVNDAVRPPEGGPAEAEVLLASSLLLSIDRPARVPDSPLKSHGTKHSD